MAESRRTLTGQLADGLLPGKESDARAMATVSVQYRANGMRLARLQVTEAGGDDALRGRGTAHDEEADVRLTRDDLWIDD